MSDILHHAQQIFSRLFPEGLPHLDVLDNPFCPELTHRQLLYPTDVCQLTPEQLSCLREFLESIGETEFYFTHSLRLLDGESEETFSLFPREVSYEELEDLFVFPVTALFSCKGTWALVISDNEYAIVGCVDTYAREFAQSFLPYLGDCQYFEENYAFITGLPDKDYHRQVVAHILDWITEKP